MIRRLEYEEIVKTNSIRAVGYLQTRLSDIVDHKDPEQLQEFHKLASLLFKCYDTPSHTIISKSEQIGDQSPAPSSPSSSSSSTQASPSTSSSNTSDIIDFKCPANWNNLQSRYQNYTPPLPTICCYGAKDAELFTNKTEEQQYEVRKERCLLYNKLIELMPEHMVQPKGNLSDFVLI